MNYITLKKIEICENPCRPITTYLSSYSEFIKELKFRVFGGFSLEDVDQALIIILTSQ